MRKRSQPPDFSVNPIIAAPIPDDHLPQIVRTCLIGNYVCGITADHQLLQLAKLVTPRTRRRKGRTGSSDGATVFQPSPPLDDRTHDD